MAYVLIVEDEPHIRLLLAALLRQLGHHVIEADNGITALEVLKNEPLIDVVVSDIVMPKLDGVELVEQIKKTRPHVRVVVSSVYRTEMEEARWKGADMVLPKPFSRQQFLGAMRNITQFGARSYPGNIYAS